MSEKFDSVNGLKLKLIDSFPEYVPSSPTFQVGYLEGRAHHKRWIVRQEDLKLMYESFNPEDDIKLWCEAKVNEESRKRGNENKEEEPKSKRERNEDIETDSCAAGGKTWGQVHWPSLHTVDKIHSKWAP